MKTSHEYVTFMLTQTSDSPLLQIEHIIQASDVSHTMQHWHIYRVRQQLISPLAKRCATNKTSMPHQICSPTPLLSTRNGTKNYLLRCIWPSGPVVWPKTQQPFGTKEKLVSSTTTVRFLSGASKLQQLPQSADLSRFSHMFCFCDAVSHFFLLSSDSSG